MACRRHQTDQHFRNGNGTSEADTILTRFGVSIRHVRGDRAFYRLSDDMITLPERDRFASAIQFYALALHEAGHATGHSSRLNRSDLGHPLVRSVMRPRRTARRIPSLMLGEQLGIGHDPGQHARLCRELDIAR